MSTLEPALCFCFFISPLSGHCFTTQVLHTRTGKKEAGSLTVRAASVVVWRRGPSTVPDSLPGFPGNREFRLWGLPREEVQLQKGSVCRFGHSLCAALLSGYSAVLPAHCTGKCVWVLFFQNLSHSEVSRSLSPSQISGLFLCVIGLGWKSCSV